MQGVRKVDWWYVPCVWLLCRSKSCQKKRALSGNTAPLGWAATLGLISANFCHNLLPCSRNGGNYNNERNSDAVNILIQNDRLKDGKVNGVIVKGNEPS